MSICKFGVEITVVYSLSNATDWRQPEYCVQSSETWMGLLCGLLTGVWDVQAVD